MIKKFKRDAGRFFGPNEALFDLHVITDYLCRQRSVADIWALALHLATVESADRFSAHRASWP